MPRPQRRRRICGNPHYNLYGPKGVENREFINLKLEEYEVIRLIDLEDHTQEECALSMEVSRTTVTSIYQNARKKIADAIINGKTIIIEKKDV